LSAKDQIKYLKKLFSSLDVLEVPTGFIPDIINAIRKDGKEVVTVYAGSDRIAGYKKMIDVYNKKLGDDQQMNVKFKKTPRVTSATTVRDAIRDDDIETFKKNMPKKLHSEWESLRKIIK
jgi:predicted nucleotidyltransferase